MSSASLSWRAYGRNLPLWFAVLFLVLSAMFVPFAVNKLNAARLLSSRGVDTQATVTSHETHTTRRSNGSSRTTYSVTLGFADQQGASQTRQIYVSGVAYHSLRIGSQTTLRYIASDPSIAEVEPGRNFREGAIMGTVGGLSVAAMLLCIGLFLRGTAAQRRALRGGDQLMARITAHTKVGKARMRTFVAEWTDGETSGRTRTMNETALPAVGSEIPVLRDPVSGKGWWVADL